MSKHCGTFIKCNNAEGCFGCEYEGEEDKHTEIPWKFGEEILGSERRFIETGKEKLAIAEMITFRDNWKANADFIVRACNSHDELLEWVRKLADQLEMGGDEIYHDINKGFVDRARQIIAKAEAH